MKRRLIPIKVRCPKCGNKQPVSIYKKRYNELGNLILVSKTKRCIWCGKSFLYYKNVNNHHVVEWRKE